MMKKLIDRWTAAAAAVLVPLLLLGFGCAHRDPEPAAPDASSSRRPEPEVMEGLMLDQGVESFKGKVIQTMNTRKYTYVLIENETGRLWAASPRFAVAAGDKVRVRTTMPMKDFYSRSFHKVFSAIYFVGEVENLTRPSTPSKQTQPELPPGHPKTTMPKGHPVLRKPPSHPGTQAPGPDKG